MTGAPVAVAQAPIKKKCESGIWQKRHTVPGLGDQKCLYITEHSCAVNEK